MRRWMGLDGRLKNKAEVLALLLEPAGRSGTGRRALAIFVASLGADHPNSHTVMGNYVVLLREMGHSEEEVLERFQSLLRELPGQAST